MAEVILYDNIELTAGDTGAQPPVRVDMGNGVTKGLHTIVARSVAFRGTAKIEAALVEQPGDADWAEVAKFSFAMHLPGGPIIAPTAETRALTVSGIFTWMRVVLAPATPSVNGYLNYIKVC